MKKKKGDLTERITITLPHEVLVDYREIARMTGYSISSLIRRRLDVRGGIVAVPEAVMKELSLIHGVLEYATKGGRIDPTMIAGWKEVVAMYERLVDYTSQVHFIHEKKRRSPSLKKENMASDETDAKVYYGMQVIK